MTLLKERYGDPQKIINAHMDALVTLPTAENARDLQAVRRLNDEGETHVRAHWVVMQTNMENPYFP